MVVSKECKNYQVKMGLLANLREKRGEFPEASETEGGGEIPSNVTKANLKVACDS